MDRQSAARIQEIIPYECIVVETINLLIQRGIDPPVWKSGNSPGGDAYNQKYLDKYLGVIKHL